MGTSAVNGDGGNDVVTVKNGELKKPITINGGDGNDTVKLGFDPIRNTVVDKSKVNFNPGKRVGDADTFEYYSKGKVSARAGEGRRWSKVFVKTTEVSKQAPEAQKRPAALVRSGLQDRVLELVRPTDASHVPAWRHDGDATNGFRQPGSGARRRCTAL